MKTLIELGSIRHETKGPFAGDIAPDAQSFQAPRLADLDKGAGPKVIITTGCSSVEGSDGAVLEVEY